MKKFLPKKNFTRTWLVGLVFLFLGVIQSYAQSIDGNLNPATEYDNGVTQTYITDNGSTCQVDQVWASFDVQSSKVYLLFSVGNGGSALFRLYFDTDNDPLTGLQEDVVGKTIVYTYGADHAIEVNSNDASGYVFYEYSLDGQTRTTLTTSGIIGASGTSIIDGSNTMEFEIPFDAINYDPCSNLSTFINVGSYASVSGNSINSTWCSAVLLDFTIGAGGEIDGPQTICAGDDVQQLNLIGHQGTIVGWQANTGTGWPASDTDIIAGTEGSTTYQPSGLNETTEYRAVVQIATGLCSEDTYVYAVPAEITVKPTPTASVSATPTTVCLSGDKPVVTFTGDNATAPYTFTYKLNNGAEQTIISNGNTATIEVPTNAVEDFTYELVSVSSANGCTSGAIIGESVTVSITDLPNCSITGDLSICPSSAGNIYSGTDEEGMTYSWSISGDASINGSTTGQTVLVDADAICGGSFILELTTTKNGCSSTCSIEGVVEDTTDPVWTLAPSDKTVECDGTNDPSGEFAAWLTSFSGSDVCGTATVTNNSIGLSDDCGATGAETVTFTLTDECGNFITKEATFTIKDTTDPVWTLAPSDKTVECDGTNDPSGEFAAWLTSFSGSDVCGTATVTNNSIGLSDDCGATGAETVTFTLTDECGNFITKEATFTIEDTTDPVWTVAPSDKTVECDGTNDPSGEFAAWLTSFSGSDVCGTATVTNNSIGLSDDCGATGAETVTFTLTDECGNFITKEATFTIEDTTDPVWTVAPSDKTVECDGTNDPSGEFAAWLTSFSGSDVCGTATVTNNSIGLSDDCGATGAETVTFTLTDECGNFITKEATFTIEDTTDPVWTLAPSDKTVECDGTNDPSGEFAAWLTSFSGSDVCGTATVTNNSIGLSDDCGATGAETVTFTLTDECGNFITKEATFTIEDTTDPVWTLAPSDKTVECDGTNDPSGEFAAWLTSFSGSDVCGTATVTNNSIGLSDDCGATGAETVTFTLTDECGNFITKEATFTIEDTTDPVWTVAPSDKTVECDGTNDPSGEFAAWLTSFSGSDVCGTATVTNNSIGLSNDCGATGAETVTFTLTDECGNFITKEATFTIKDTTDPVWTVAPSDKTVECDGTNDPSGEFAAWLTSFSGSDVCGTATVTNNSIGLSDDCGATGAETVTFTLTDECGNFITKEATFTIEDTTDPVWTLAPSDKTVECDGTNDPSGEFAAWLTSFSGSDVCGTATVTNNSIGLSDDCGATGAETVTFTLTDECGNFITKDATFTIEDTTDPVWTLAPSDKTVECDGTNDPSGEFAAWLTSFSGSDVCGTATVTNNSIGLSDDCGATGAETVTFTLTDECGNFITKDATFTIEDTTDPVWTVAPSDKTVECDGTNDPSGEFAAWLTSFSGSDVCGTATVTNNSIGLSDDCGATGAETVTFTLTDECGNFITKEATFTIKDTTDPVWTVAPSDKTVECDGTNDPSGEFAAWLTSFSGSDVCGTATVTNNSIGLSDDCGATGAETVTFTLTDECGNFITKEATFTIKDTTDPVWTVAPSDKTVECDGTNDPSGEFAAWLTSFSGSDVCGTATVTNNSIGLSDDCGATGAETVTFTLTDECGNFITKEATFTIKDTTDPVWTLAPSDKTVECDGTNDPSGEFAAWLTSFSGSDVCGTATVTNNSIGLSDDCGATGAETVTFTLTDECGNFITKEATFTIKDTTDPVWTLAPSDKTVECDGTNDPSGEFAAWLTSFSGSDVCGTATVTNNSIGLSDDCGATGAETVTFTLTDECGNFITKEATFTIKDTTDPVWTLAPSDKTVECDGTNDPSGEFAAWLTSFSGSDVCGTATVTNNSIGLSDDCGATGAETVTFTLTDECGNFITKEATFTIEDTTDPVWTLAPSDKTVECDGTNDPSGEFAAWLTSFSGSDVCGTATVTNNSIGLSDDCGATGAETVTFTLTDECGNFITKEATFTIEDTTDPVWTVAPSDKTVECDGTNDPSGEFAAWLTSFSGSDVCGTATVTNNSIGLSDDCGATGAETVTFTLTDECGNFITKDATFTIEDTTDPVWTVAPSDKTVECDGTNDPSGEFAAWLTSFSGSDVCGTATVTNNSIGLSDDCGATGAETVTFTLTDECGNFITKEATFTIKDTTDPVWTLAPSDKTVECDGTNDPSGEFAAWLTSFSGSDVCGTATVTNNSIGLSDDCGATGAETVTFTLTDECGNFITKDATFTIEDTTDPVWTVAPSDKTVECDGTNDPSGEFAAWLTSFSGSDVCGTATVTNNSIGLSDDCGATGAETVTFTLTDECGNFITKDATFTIEDTTDPVWTVAPSDKTVECDGTNDPSGEFAAWLTSFSGSDVCGTATVTNNSIGLSDDCGATGAETVTFTLTDECGNFITKEATFTIKDTTDPVWTLAPSDKTVECDGTNDPSGEFAAWLTSFSGSDVCGTATVTNNSIGLSDDCGATGAETVTFTLTDECGNFITKDATFTIEDTTDPTIDNTNLTNIDIECGIDPANKLSDWLANHAGATATDNCGDVTWSNNYGENQNIQCEGGAITVIFTATDACGNASTTSASYSIQDNTTPTFNETLPTTEITAECDAVVEAVVLTASDNCDSDVPVVFTETKTDGDCANNYTLIRTWTATDDCGNETSHTQTVVVSDNTAPEVTCNDITVQLDANGAATITVDDINGSTTDACSDIDTMFISQATFNCDNVGENQVTLTAIDECGNEATCTATVTVEEGDADCGLQPFKANDDILSLVYCPEETVSGDLDLFANDEGFTSENVNFTILTDLPEGVSVTDGNLLYANENPTEAVITFTYSVCHTVNTENCSTAEVTIQLLVDTDCDGVPDIDDLDDDDDGILDIIEEENALDQTSLDSDGDGIVDRLDIDADNDGIVDNVEWQSTIAEGGEYDYIFPLGTDSNGDGWDDAYDPASNGITYEPWDMDLDGTPDYLDTNTDNEGEDDNVEGWDKFPNDSIADVSYIGSDADKDGLDDAYETYNTTTEEWAPGQNAIGSDAYLQDTDDDGVRDWRDAVDDRTPPEQFACGDPVIPNAFSPNQDGYNDYFKVMIYCTGTQGGNEERVLGDDFTDARIEIFNRWGNLVYEQERYGDEDYWGDVDAWWNGRSTHNMQVGSDQLPTATYYYILYFNDGSREPITGFVFLNN
nr:gliding motility-associated C-terminal domain-containing protein [uncultured Draconibacterium sp.]